MRIACRRKEAAPGRDAFVHHDAILGDQRADRLRQRDRVDLAGRERLRAILRRLDWLLRRAELVGEPFERVDRVLLDGRERGELRILWREQTRLFLVSEKNHPETGDPP